MCICYLAKSHFIKWCKIFMLETSKLTIACCNWYVIWVAHRVGSDLPLSMCVQRENVCSEGSSYFSIISTGSGLSFLASISKTLSRTMTGKPKWQGSTLLLVMICLPHAASPAQGLWAVGSAQVLSEARGWGVEDDTPLLRDVWGSVLLAVSFCTPFSNMLFPRTNCLCCFIADDFCLVIQVLGNSIKLPCLYLVMSMWVWGYTVHICYLNFGGLLTEKQ